MVRGLRPQSPPAGISAAEDNYGRNPALALIKKLENMKIGGRIVDLGFMSTSTGSASSDYGPEGSGFEGATLIINARKGDKALPLIETHQGEILFQKGTELELVGKPSKGKFVLKTVRSKG